ncbi:MAG TPA: murein biosynthesis integral membrane protein MurJ [Acidimicrobiales bacterium]|nr:murein biosynthesis integral membrane protein MurJ [Acidimicrobiales bacterium]
MTSPARALGGRTGGAPTSESSRLNRAALAMATGTLLSRFTGFAKLAALGYALGVKSFVADAYNLANNTPNIIFDLLLGGVLSATVVPVFVEHLAVRDERDAWEDISAAITLAAVVLVVGTAVFELLAPQIIGLFTAGTRGATPLAERQAATFLLRLFAPQVAFYGLIALITAILNSRRRFGPPMFVPIANNLVVIGVLLTVHALFPAPTLVQAAHDPLLLLLLGIGTTGGVVVQGLLLLPSLWRAVPSLPPLRPFDQDARAPARHTRAEVATAGDTTWDRLEHLGRVAARRGRRALRFRWDPGNAAVRSIFRLGGWTFASVVANQAAYFTILHLALVSGEGGASAYTYAYTFFQLPFGVVAVSIMTAIQPELAEHWARSDLPGYRRRAAGGLRAVVVAIIPPAVGYVILAVPICSLVLAHGAGNLAGAQVTAKVLQALSLGLPGFCGYLFLCSALQAMQDTRTMFVLYLVENGINVLAAYLLEPFLGVQGLGLAMAIAYTAAALIAAPVLRRRATGGHGPASEQAPAVVSETGQLYLELPTPDNPGAPRLGGRRLRPPVGSSLGLGRALVRVCVLSAIMAVVTYLVSTHVGSDLGAGDLLRVTASVFAGLAVFGVGTAVAATVSRRRGQGTGGVNGTGATDRAD